MRRGKGLIESREKRERITDREIGVSEGPDYPTPLLTLLAAFFPFLLSLLPSLY